MDIKEIEESWSKTSTIYNRTLTEAQANIWTLLSHIKELEEEKKGMVRLTEADMKKLGWSYT